MKVDTSKLVDAQGLLEALFDERFRPTVRWVRLQQKKRNIPFIKWGHYVFFNVEEVRTHLERLKTIRAKPQRRALCQVPHACDK